MHDSRAPRNGLRCHVEPDRDHVVVRPVGEIDVATVASVGAPLDQLRDAGWKEIVLDLRSVSFMDSTGLRLLIRESQRDGGVRLRVDVAPGGAVHRLLALTGMLEHLPIRLVGDA